MSTSLAEQPVEDEVLELDPDPVYADREGRIWVDLGDGGLIVLDYYVIQRLRRQYPLIKAEQVPGPLRPMIPVPVG